MHSCTDVLAEAIKYSIHLPSLEHTRLSVRDALPSLFQHPSIFNFDTLDVTTTSP